MDNKKKKIILIVIGCICLIVAALCLIVISQLIRGGQFDSDKYKNDTVETVVPDDTLETADITQPPDTDESSDITETTEPPSDNPIDFNALKSENEDIYAWIQVPGTVIDYPIVQSDISDEYYLRRNYLGKYDVCGCIFTQSLNKKDFSDRNTVVYGHYMWNGTFFGCLHYFRDPDFFANNTEIIVYTPGHKYTYEIFAAYEYDSRHILYSFNFDDDEVYEQYLADCLNPQSMSRNVREGIVLTKEDKIITLSTCLKSGVNDRRYLVQGVLRTDTVLG